MIPCTIVFISPLPTIVLDGKRYRKVGTLCLRWFQAIMHQTNSLCKSDVKVMSSV